MNSDDKFWISVWSIAATALVTIAITIATYNHSKNVVISEMIKNGASPTEVLCALDDTYGDNPTCIITATKLKE